MFGKKKIADERIELGQVVETLSGLPAGSTVKVHYQGDAVDGIRPDNAQKTIDAYLGTSAERLALCRRKVYMTRDGQLNVLSVRRAHPVIPAGDQSVLRATPGDYGIEFEYRVWGG